MFWPLHGFSHTIPFTPLIAGCNHSYVSKLLELFFYIYISHSAFLDFGKVIMELLRARCIFLSFSTPGRPSMEMAGEGGSAAENKLDELAADVLLNALNFSQKVGVVILDGHEKP